MIEPLRLNNRIVTKARTKKLKRKSNYSSKIRIDKETLRLIEQLNEQIDRAEIEAKRGAMTYIVRI